MGAASAGGKSGTGILVASILTSVALIVTYVFAGGLDFKPTPVADPCDSRAWTDPSGLEDTAQQHRFLGTGRGGLRPRGES